MKTMTRITHDHLTRSGEPDEYTTDASTLRLKPGEWPTRIEVADDVGNGIPLIAIALKKIGDEPVGVTYRQGNGSLEVIVYNE